MQKDLFGIEVVKKEIPLAELKVRAIKADFKKLTVEKHLDSDYVLENILRTKYFLEVETLWRIISNTGYYKKL